MGDRSIIIPTSERICVFSHSVVSDSLRSHGTVACQALLSMEFSRQEYWCVCVCVKSLQLCPTFCDPKTVVLGDSPSEKTEEYWSGLLFPSPGDLPDLGIEPASPALAGRFFTSEPPGKPLQRKTWYLAKSD